MIHRLTVRFFEERMQGGMDEIIISKLAGLTMAAATGKLDHWAETARGCLALMIALDQFPRSLWRDTPASFGQNIKATRLALEGSGMVILTNTKLGSRCFMLSRSRIARGQIIWNGWKR